MWMNYTHVVFHRMWKTLWITRGQLVDNLSFAVNNWLLTPYGPVRNRSPPKLSTVIMTRLIHNPQSTEHSPQVHGPQEKTRGRQDPRTLEHIAGRIGYQAEHHPANIIQPTPEELVIAIRRPPLVWWRLPVSSRWFVPRTG
jgi:hypothetical protein